MILSDHSEVMDRRAIIVEVEISVRICSIGGMGRKRIRTVNPEPVSSAIATVVRHRMVPRSILNHVQREVIPPDSG